MIPAAGLPIEQVNGEPSWIEPSLRFTPGADPIGLQTITTDRVIPRLMPGVLALSDRARYLSFFAYLLRRYQDERRPPSNGPLSRYIKEREYEYALAVRMCPRGCGAGPMGSNRAAPAIAAHPASFERNESVLSDLGGYGLYYRSPMRSLGLVAPAGTALGETTTPVDVLVPGSARAQKLAAAFETAVADTAYVRQYIDGSSPIPAEVLIEYSTRACLCRLPEWSNERELLRAALLEYAPDQDRSGVTSRRQGFALFLQLLDAGHAVGGSDDSLRWGVWSEFEQLDPSERPLLAHTLARWAAVAAGHFVQDGLTLLWTDGGERLRAADRGNGLTRAEVRSVVGTLANVGALQLPVGSVGCVPDLPTEEFRQSLESSAMAGLPQLVRWARADGRAIAGLALILGSYLRLPTSEAASGGWLEFGSIDGEWQPGLLTLGRLIEAHMADRPTIADSLRWFMDHFVLRAHESIAYNKLPEFTFRFRWEAGRLRFYNHRFNWVGPGDIRSASMATLLKDLGFWEPSPAGPAVTSDGAAFLTEVLG